MAGKRVATSDLNHDNWDQEDDGEEAGTFAQANPDVLKDRVIKRAKRRGATTEGASNIFASFGGFKSAATPAAASFDFLAKEKKNESGDGPTPAKQSNSFAFSSPDKAVESNAGANPSSGFTFGSSKQSFAFGSGNKSSTKHEPVKTGFVFGSKPADPPTGTGFSFGGQSDKPAAASGFVFGTKSEPAKPSFGLDPKPAENPKANEDEKKVTSEVKNPSESLPPLKDLFKLKPGSWNCSTCSLVNDADKAKCVSCEEPKPGGAPAPVATAPVTTTAKKWECPTCCVFNDADKLSCVCCETSKPGTSVTTDSTKSLSSSSAFGSTPFSSSGFKFGVPPNGSSGSTGSGFKFGESSSKSSTETGFKFGTSTSKPSSENSGFKFGNAEKKSDSKAEYPQEFLADIKALNNGVINWAKTHFEKNPYIYLTPVFKDYEKHLSELKATHKIDESGPTAVSSSGNGHGSEEAVSKVGSNGTSGEKKESPKPTTGFGFGTAAPKTGFSFGTSETKTVPTSVESSEKPSSSLFSFGGAAANTTETKTGFGFGAPANTTETKTGFSFGSSANTAETKTGFSFGSSANTTEAKSGFSFGSGGAKPGFSFGAATSGSIFGSFGGGAAKPTAEATKDEEDDEDQPPKVEVAPVVEEDSIFSVRCKLFYKKGSEFAEKGLGMLHLKPVPESNKTQMLLRAETSLGNILLNVMLNPQMNFLPRGNNIQFVCVPNPAIPGIDSGPVSMLIKVKNAEIAGDLVTHIKQRLKSDE